MKYFVFFFLVIGFVRSEISERECIEARYQNLTLGSNEEAEFCEKIFQNFTTEFSNDIKERLTVKDNLTCILQSFNYYNISSLYLRGLTKHLISNRSHDENDAYEDDVDESINALLKAVKVLCTADRIYGNDFDTYFNSSRHQNNSMKGSLSELCIKKYFVDKKIVNPTLYSINPLLINVVNCSEIVLDLERMFEIPKDEDFKKNTFFGLSAANAQICTKEKFTEEHVLENVYWLKFVETMVLTQQQIDELRSKYIKLMTSSVKFLLLCIKEI